MNNDNLLKQIEKIITPLKDGQDRLEEGLKSQGNFLSYTQNCLNFREKI